MVTCRAHSAERPSPDGRTGQTGGLSRRLLGSLTSNLTRGQTQLFVLMVLATVVFLASFTPTVSADGNVYYVPPTVQMIALAAPINPGGRSRGLRIRWRRAIR